MAVTLGREPITVERFVAVARHGARVEFDAVYVDRVRKSRALVERFLAENRLVYGVTTGFGDNVTKVIDPGTRSGCSGTSCGRTPCRSGSRCRRRSSGPSR